MRYAINRKLVTFRVLAEGAVIVNGASGAYYTLNSTGTFLWELLDKRDMSLKELSAELARAFDADEQAVAADVEEHLRELSREDLVVVT